MTDSKLDEIANYMLTLGKETANAMRNQEIWSLVSYLKNTILNLIVELRNGRSCNGCGKSGCSGGWCSACWEAQERSEKKVIAPTLRDQFAMEAENALIARAPMDHQIDTGLLARAAYDCADAMLAARERVKK